MALDCLKMAEGAHDPTIRDDMIRLAKLWTRLADQAKKSASAERLRVLTGKGGAQEEARWGDITPLAVASAIELLLALLFLGAARSPVIRGSITSMRRSHGRTRACSIAFGKRSVAMQIRTPFTTRLT